MPCSKQLNQWLLATPLSANHKIFGMDILRRFVKNLLCTLFALCLQVVVICQIIGLGAVLVIVYHMQLL